MLCFQVMVPDASVLGSKQFPAPAAQTWKAVAEAMSKGLGSLGPVKVWSIVIGGLVGIVLPLLAKLFPKHEKWIPSAAGLGLAWTFHWYYQPAVLPRRGHRLWLREKIAQDGRRVHLSRGFGHRRRRLADGAWS